MIMVQELATESPISVYETSLDDTFQCADVSPCWNALMLRLLWSGTMIARTIDSNQMRQS